MFLIQSNRNCVSGSHFKSGRRRAPRTHFGKPPAKQCKPAALSPLLRNDRNAHQFRLIAEHTHVYIAEQCVLGDKHKDTVIRRA